MLRKFTALRLAFISSDLSNVSDGQSLNLTVGISATNGNTAGFFLESSVGQFSIVDSGTKISGNARVWLRFFRHLPCSWSEHGRARRARLGLAPPSSLAHKFGPG